MDPQGNPSSILPEPESSQLCTLSPHRFLAFLPWLLLFAFPFPWLQGAGQEQPALELTEGETRTIQGSYEKGVVTQPRVVSLEWSGSPPTQVTLKAEKAGESFVLLFAQQRLVKTLFVRVKEKEEVSLPLFPFYGEGRGMPEKLEIRSRTRIYLVAPETLKNLETQEIHETITVRTPLPSGYLSLQETLRRSPPLPFQHLQGLLSGKVDEHSFQVGDITLPYPYEMGGGLSVRGGAGELRFLRLSLLSGGGYARMYPASPFAWGTLLSFPLSTRAELKGGVGTAPQGAFLLYNGFSLRDEPLSFRFEYFPAPTLSLQGMRGHLGYETPRLTLSARFQRAPQNYPYALDQAKISQMLSLTARFQITSTRTLLAGLHRFESEKFRIQILQGGVIQSLSPYDLLHLKILVSDSPPLPRSFTLLGEYQHFPGDHTLSGSFRLSYLREPTWDGEALRFEPNLTLPLSRTFRILSGGEHTLPLKISLIIPYETRVSLGVEAAFPFLMTRLSTQRYWNHARHFTQQIHEIQVISPVLPQQLLAFSGKFVQESLYGSFYTIELVYELAIHPAEFPQNLVVLFTPAELEGVVFEDRNSNGFYDPAVDLPLPGVEIVIDGKIRVRTDQEGRYRSGILEKGYHEVTIVKESLPPQGRLTTPDLQRVYLDHVPARASFGYTKQGVIYVKIVNDLDLNGNPDPGEPALPGVRFFLYGKGGQWSQSTNLQGFWSDTMADPGSYTIVLDPRSLPPDFLLPVTSQSFFLLPSDFKFITFLATANRGLRVRLYRDTNKNQKQDPGEPFLKNVEVRLNGFRALSDEQGVVFFRGLPAGQFLLLIRTPQRAEPLRYPVTLPAEPGIQEVSVGL